jgi:hypothetical protein
MEKMCVEKGIVSVVYVCVCVWNGEGAEDTHCASVCLPTSSRIREQETHHLFVVTKNEEKKNNNTRLKKEKKKLQRKKKRQSAEER